MSAGSLQSGKLQPVLNGLDSSSNSNTPTHSRNNSNTSLNVMVSPSSGASIDSMSKSVGDVFNGFVIGVHRKMVSWQWMDNVILHPFYPYFSHIRMMKRW